MKRALIVKMWALGDILMATPLISALRTQYPGVHLTWVVDESHGELLRNHPGIDELFVLDSGSWRRLLRKGNVFGWLKRSQEIRREMAARHFDLAINCHPDKWWTAILCAAPVRVGLYPYLELPWSRRFYTHPLPRPAGMHNTDHYLTATRAVGIPDGDKRLTMGETPDEAPFVAEFYERHNLNQNRPTVVIAPFSTGENRNWEPERYAALSDWLTEAMGAQVILTHAPRDADAARAITDRCRMPIIRADGTTLRQYIALLRHANLVVCVDSSAMHLAAALNTPYVALFGATPVAERAPLVGRGLPLAHSLPCAPCDRSDCTNRVFRECMKLITVEEVQAAVIRLGLGASAPEIALEEAPYVIR